MARFSLESARVARAATLPVALLMSLVSSSAMAQAHFARVDYTAPSTIRAAVGDFNEDGILDIVAATTSGMIEPHNVSLLLGTGGGAFGAPTDFAAGDSPYDLVVLDFDKNGDLDVAVVNITAGGAEVRVLFGDGTGQLGAPQLIASVGPVGDYRHLTVGDFNGDTNPDLAVDNYNQNKVDVLLGDGTGGVTSTVTTSFTPGNTPGLGPAVDFDGDGNLDLVVLQGYNVREAHILKGDGTGAFTQFSGSPIALGLPGNPPFDSVIGDFNLDGDFDIAVISASTTTILLGDGTGAFTTSSFAAGGYYIRTGDFDGDAKPDLALVTAGSLDIWRGDGAGGFTFESTRGAAAEKPLVADLNGDSKPDIAQASGQVSVYLNTTQNTTTTLASSPNPSALGSLATFTATVTGPSPSGTMTFKADGINIANCGVGGVVTFSGSTAVCSTTGLSYGSHTITAEFSGNAPYNPSSDTLSGGHSVITVAPTLVNFVSPGGGTVVGLAPVAVAVGDFDNDGKEDWVAANSGESSVSIALGNGGGGFMLTPGSPVAVGANPRSVAVGDLDGDGKQDLAVANADSDNVSLLKGDGLGGFTPLLTLAAGTTPNAVVVGDFNGDGKKDLAVTNFGGGVSLWQGDGLGAFTPLAGVSVGNGPIALAVGDFNGDGKQDLAAANTTDNNVSILIGNGAGAFAAAVNFGVGTGPISVAVGDLNNDGKQDLAVANNGSDNVSVLIGDGLGGFAAAVSFAAGDSPRGVLVDDFNGDGKRDVAVANQNDNNVSILRGNGSGSLTAATNFPAGGGPFGLAAGDFNRDGKRDIAVADITDGKVSILLGQGFTQASLAATGAGPVSIAAGDFDLDGKRDLAVVNINGDNASILKNDGAGAFSPAGVVALGTKPSSIVVSHFDGDAGLDLAVANRDSFDLSIRLGDGSGAFVVGSDPATAGPSPVAIARGFFDADGFEDLVTVNKSSDSLSIWLGDGSGNFALAAPDLTATDARSVATGDIDGDGDIDLVTADFSSNTVSVYLGAGDGTFAAPASFAVLGGPVSVVVGDFNKDEDLDVATANGGGNNVSVLLGDGTGSLAAPTNFMVGSQPRSIGVTDFNNDQRLDLVVANSADDNVSILLGKSGGFDGPINFPVGDEPIFVTAADLNGDNRPDLAVANFGGGTGNTVSILLNTFSTPPNKPTSPVATAGTGQISISFTPPTVDGGSPVNGYIAKCNPGSHVGLAAASATSITVSGLTNGTLYTCAVAAENAVGSSPASDAVMATPFAATSTTSVVSSSNPSTLGASVTFTATVTGFSPTGTVDFTDDIDGALCTGVALSSGVATCSTSALVAGPHVMTASYSGDANNSSSNGTPSGGQTVLAAAPTFGGPVVTAVTGPQSLTLANLDGNGDPDLVVTQRADDQVTNLFGQTGGGFTSSADVVGDGPVAAVVGSFEENFDSDQDRVIINRDDSSVTVLFSAGWSTSFGVGPQPVAGGTGDFNVDGFADLAIVNSGGDSVTILLGDGNGGFSEEPSSPISSGNGEPSAVAVGDFDGDTVLDLAVTNESANEVSILFGAGDGTFGLPVNVGVGTSPSSLICSDLDDDGDLDLAVANRSDDNVTILLNDGFGIFTSPAGPFAVGSAPRSIDVADFNGDTKKDLVVANFGDDKLSILFGDGTGRFSAPVHMGTGTGSAPSSVTVADFNGDGKDDLAVANSGTDEVLLFLNSVTLPSVNNPAATNVTATAADVSADVTADGGNALTDQGFVFSSTNATPTLGGMGVSTVSLSGTGVATMSTTLSGLSSSTTYYFRGYASNILGTSYSAPETFTTLAGCPVISLLGPLPHSIVNTAGYNASVEASNGVAPYGYLVTSGALPPGLSLDANTGAVTGTPTSVGTFVSTIRATDDNGCTGSVSYTVHIGSAILPGDLVIREFRWRGPAGQEDEYVEVFNKTAGPLTIVAADGSSGYAIAAERTAPSALPAVLVAIPNGTRLERGQSFLAVNATVTTGYSLKDYGGVGKAVHDAAWTVDVFDNSGVGVFRSTSLLDGSTRIDAVGFSTSAADYKEGGGLSPAAGITVGGEWAFVRQAPYPAGVVRDSGNNSLDFVFQSTNAGVYGGVQSALGSPGPQNVASPRNVPMPSGLADPSVAPTLAPNKTQSGNYHYFRRKVTNNTGVAIGKIRLRISAITTLFGVGYNPGVQADWRGISTTDASITVVGPGTVTARGVTLEAPTVGYSASGKGAGYNASFIVDLSDLGLAGLPDGESIYVNLGFRNVKGGSYYFILVPEFLPVPPVS